MRRICQQTCLMVLVVAGAAVIRANAGNGCCEHCGSAESCQKVCRLVQEEKKTDIVCWGCKSEKFCVPGPSKPNCKHVDVVCGTCDEDCNSSAPHAKPKKFSWTDWIPGRATVHTKQKLMKKVVTQKVPSYRWVVEDLCGACKAKCEVAAVAPDIQVPPPPVAGAKLKLSRSESVAKAVN